MARRRATRDWQHPARAARPRQLPRHARLHGGGHARPGTGRLERGSKSMAIRNAQATVVAPTGTIGLVMDCDTTGIEPDFALVKFKKLAGGGYFKIINRAVPAGLMRCASATNSASRSTRWSTMRSATAHLKPMRRGSTMQTLKAERGFGDETARDAIEAGAGDGLRHPVRVQQVDAGRGPSAPGDSVLRLRRPNWR